MASATATAAGCVRWRCTRRRDALGSHVPLRDPVSALRITTKTNVKRGTWDSPDVENEKPGGDSSDESHSEVALNLDDEEASDTNDPPEMSPFEPDRDDGMPKMPVPKIEIQNPGGWSPIAYAFLGDAVFELYVRRLFFNPPQRPNDYDLKCKRAVRAEAQDKLLRLLIDRGEFTDPELKIVKWGRNASYGNVPTRLRGKGKGGFAIYRNASALECVVGYLYMTDLARLEELMSGLGGELENVAKVKK